MRYSVLLNIDEDPNFDINNLDISEVYLLIAEINFGGVSAFNNSIPDSTLVFTNLDKDCRYFLVDELIYSSSNLIRDSKDLPERIVKEIEEKLLDEKGDLIEDIFKSVSEYTMDLAKNTAQSNLNFFKSNDFLYKSIYNKYPNYNRQLHSLEKEVRNYKSYIIWK